MGFSRRRRGKDGKPRYTAYYRDLRGREVSAGTFARKADADAAWQAAEVNARAGLRHDPGRGRQTFQHYAEAVWLPNHRMELSTRADYTSAINRHILWYFGPMKMRDIGPAQVREWITALKARGVSPRRIEYSKTSVLGAIFTTALEDGVIAAHPSHRVATDPVPRKPRKILTAHQFDALYAALPDSDAQLLVETAIETGLRWGELTELRATDIDFPAGVLTVSRAVSAVSRKHHPAGRRFWVKNYPKDKEYRQLRMSDQIVRKLSEHLAAHDLGAGDLLFARRGDRGPANSRLDRTRPGRAKVPAWHHDRLRTGPVPVRALPPRRRLLPGAAAPHRPRPAQPRPPCRGRPAPARQHVPDERPPAGLPGRRNRGCHLPRPAPRARLMAARRRRGPPGGERATWARQNFHHRGVPAHPPGC